MGKLLGLSLIGTGSMLLFNIIIMALGGMEIMVGLMLPTFLKLAPVNEQLLAWVEVPIPIAVEMKLSNVRSFKEDGIIGGGMMDFEMTMSGGGPDGQDLPYVAAMYIQEELEITEIQRYYLNAGPLNYPSIFSWLIALGFLGALVTSIVFRLRGRKNSASVGIDRGSTKPSGKIVQVIALDETFFKD